MPIKAFLAAIAASLLVSVISACARSVAVEESGEIPIPTTPSLSRYLIYPQNSSNYPISEIAPGWGSAHPAIGTLINNPFAYGSSGQRRADHTQLLGDYGGSVRQNSLIVYSRFTPVNTNGKYVLVHGENSTSCWVFSTKTNEPMFGGAPLRMKPSMGIASRALGENNELRWDYTGEHPNRLYFVGRGIANSQAVGTENVSTSFYSIEFDPETPGTQPAPVLIHDFSTEFASTGIYPTGGYANAAVMNDVEGDSSNDSRYWAFQLMNDALGTGYLPYAIVTFDRQTNTILGRLQRDCTGVPSPCTAVSTPATALPYLSRPNMVEISPSGLRVILDWGRVYTGNRDADLGRLADGPKGCLKDMSDCIRIGVDETHSGWAWGPAGEELFVLQNNRNDFIEAVDIASAETANCTVITGNQYTCGIKIAQFYPTFDPSYQVGMHFGKIYNSALRGWALLGASGPDDASWISNQFVMMEIKPYNASSPPRQWRISSSFNTHHDYRSEGSGALNFTATEIWTTGNYGLPQATNANEVYSIVLPSNWHDYLQPRGL